MSEPRRRLPANRSRPAALGRALAVAACALLAPPLAAQEGPVTFEFSFSNPGARSLGLGGAFAALADDATAAFANPAGLVQLLEPELSAEARGWSYDTPFVRGGRAAGVASGNGIDRSDGLRFGVSTVDATGFSFASYVYPAGRLSLAVYRHLWADYRVTSEVDGLFAEVDGELERSTDVRARTRVRVVNSGLAGGFRLTPELSVGVGLVFYRAEMDSFSAEYAQAEEQLFESSRFRDETLDTSYSYRADNSGFALHGGLLWRLSESWSVGAFYRQGPRMNLRVVETAGAAADESPPGTVELDATTPLRLPDVYGLGLAYRTANGQWAVSGEWARVGYSAITADLDVAIFEAGQIRIEDGDEWRLGVERVFSRGRPIVALRAGVWSDPDHRVGSGPQADVFERAIFQSGATEVHYAAGLGVVFARIQVDVGVDVSPLVNVASVSLVYRF